jgi:predicted esterase
MSDERPLRVQFIHGLEGSPQGTKARVLAEHFEAETPAMDTSDFDACVALQRETLERFAPDVLVGSSFGGAVALELLWQGAHAGPTLLLAQAAFHLGKRRSLPEGARVLLVHGSRDDIVDPEDSRKLAATGTAGAVELLEVDDEHSLSASVQRGELLTWVRRAHAMAAGTRS